MLHLAAYKDMREAARAHNLAKINLPCSPPPLPGWVEVFFLVYLLKVDLKYSSIWPIHQGSCDTLSLAPTVLARAN